jgi:hypothetical protein
MNPKLTEKLRTGIPCGHCNKKGPRGSLCCVSSVDALEYGLKEVLLDGYITDDKIFTAEK